MDVTRLKKLASEIRQKTEMEKSMKLARQRQLHMLPSVPKVEGYDFNVYYQPCANVSGDFYDFINVSPTEIGIALGDVAGHGIEAGIIMGMAKKALEIYAQGVSSPKEALARTNADLGKDLDGKTFVSAGYAVLDTKARVLRFVRAGNNAPYLVNPAREPKVREVKPNGMAIGVDKHGKLFPITTKEEVIQLQSGDVFFQYTDGLVEAPDKFKVAYGEERLKELLIKNCHRPLVELLELIDETIQSHIAGGEQQDDITMIALKVI